MEIILKYTGNIVNAMYDGDDDIAMQNAEKFAAGMQAMVSKEYPAADVSVETEWNVSGCVPTHEILGTENLLDDEPIRDHIYDMENEMLENSFPD